MRLFNRLRRAAELQRRAHNRRHRRLLSGYGPVELRAAEGCLAGQRAAKDARRAMSGMPPAAAPRDPQARKQARAERMAVLAATLREQADSGRLERYGNAIVKDVTA